MDVFYEDCDEVNLTTLLDSLISLNKEIERTINAINEIKKTHDANMFRKEFEEYMDAFVPDEKIHKSWISLTDEDDSDKTNSILSSPLEMCLSTKRKRDGSPSDHELSSSSSSSPPRKKQKC